MTAALAGSGLVAALAATVIGASVWRTEGPVSSDHLLERVLGREGLLRGVFDVVGPGALHPMARLADLGSAPVVLVATLLVLAAAALTRDARTLLYCLLTEPVVAVLVELCLKPTVHRTRYGFVSYPSMHTAGATALAVVAMVVVRRQFRGWLSLLLGSAAVALVVLAVGVGVAYSGFHEPTDVVGGALVGAATALLLAAVIYAPWLGVSSRCRASR